MRRLMQYMSFASQPVGPGVVACSCHIVVAEQSIRDGQRVLRAVVNVVEHRFGITHTTVQVEVGPRVLTRCICFGRESSGRNSPSP